MVRTQALEIIMGMLESIGTASDRVLATLIAGIELEFGRGAGEALAQRFLEAEESDFLWEARVAERWLGSYESVEDDDFDLERIAICGWSDGRWFVAVMLIDGEGLPHGTMGKRVCSDLDAAQQAMRDAA
jgi:hypothetical protein